MDGPWISQQESTGQGNEQNEIEQIKFYNEVRKNIWEKITAALPISASRACIQRVIVSLVKINDHCIQFENGRAEIWPLYKVQGCLCNCYRL